MARDVFILGGKRTPMGEYVGALKDISAIDLGAIAARAALETTAVAPEEIDHTIIGNALQTVEGVSMFCRWGRGLWLEPHFRSTASGWLSSSNSTGFAKTAWTACLIAIS